MPVGVGVMGKGMLKGWQGPGVGGGGGRGSQGWGDSNWEGGNGEVGRGYGEGEMRRGAMGRSSEKRGLSSCKQAKINNYLFSNCYIRYTH